MNGQVRGVALTVAVFVLAGVAGGILWHQLVDLPAYTRTADNGSMQALELSRSISIDAWYAVIACALAVVLGAAATLRASESPRLNVLVLVLAPAVAGLLMLAVGRWLGPGDVEARLAAASEGDRVPVQLVPNAGTVDLLVAQVHVIFVVWPIAALIGAALVLVLRPPPRDVGGPG